MNRSDQNLVINRVKLKIKPRKVWLRISEAKEFVPVGKKALWLKNKLSHNSSLANWISKNKLKDDDILALEFTVDKPIEVPNAINCDIMLDRTSPFAHLVFKQAISSHFSGYPDYFINPILIGGGVEVIRKMEAYNDDFDRYQKIAFFYKDKREEMILQITSNKTLFSKQVHAVSAGNTFVDTSSKLLYRTQEERLGLSMFSGRIQDPPERFDYAQRFKELKSVTEGLHSSFHSSFFEEIGRQFINVPRQDTQSVIRTTNQMMFADNRTQINAAFGMREFGPYKKAIDSDKTELIFIYQNKDHANKLYLHLRNGLKQFPGLLSYVGIPVALADSAEQFKYSSTNKLLSELEVHLSNNLSDKEYTNKLAIVIGPFKKYESGEMETELYYQIKQRLLLKGIPSQFVSPQTIQSYSFNYSLPNIAIAILAKLGGIPWKLDVKRINELVVGFNTRKLNDNIFIGNAVFFDNEGRLGGVRGFHENHVQGIINGLKEALEAYLQTHGQPDRLIIHYYKPSSSEEIRALDSFLKNDLGLELPYAIIEVNDSKSKLDLCFDMNFKFMIPRSGTYVKIGQDEYLLFNNSRYTDHIASLPIQELPVKVKISYMSSEVFSKRELISQVYEFSRLNWKGLKQKSLPATTTFSKLIADFAAHFGGDIPETITAQQRPWFL